MPNAAAASPARSHSPPAGAASQSSVSESDSGAPEGKRERAAPAVPSLDNKRLTNKESKPVEEVDPRANILTGYMKLRNAMKSWKNRWFVLRAGRLIYYKSEKARPPSLDWFI